MNDATVDATQAKAMDTAGQEKQHAAARTSDAAEALGGHPSRFINRELSWLPIQPPCAGRGREHLASGARASALPVDLGQQSR